MYLDHRLTLSLEKSLSNDFANYEAVVNRKALSRKLTQHVAASIDRRSDNDDDDDIVAAAAAAALK